MGSIPMVMGIDIFGTMLAFVLKIPACFGMLERFQLGMIQIVDNFDMYCRCYTRVYF